MTGHKLVIVGDGEFAEIAYEYFTHDSPHDVVAFAVERDYLTKSELFGLPVMSIDELPAAHPPADHLVFVAVTHTQLNRVRTRLVGQMRAMGYACATYVSSRAFVWHNVEVGANCFIFEGNVLQHHVKVGDNVILWSGNHIGHRAKVDDNCFFSSHVVVSGYARIGASCFMGVNSTIGDKVTIGADVVVGAGAVVLKDVADRQIMRGNPAVAANIDSHRMFRLREAQ